MSWILAVNKTRRTTKAPSNIFVQPRIRSTSKDTFVLEEIDAPTEKDMEAQGNMIWAVGEVHTPILSASLESHRHNTFLMF